MDKVLANGKEYEVVAVEYDPLYKDLVVAIEVVRKFIIDKGLIVYGGSAIDYAMRLKGDKLYPDNVLPDWDFYSPDCVAHSYELADIFYNMGYENARSINAEHMETMRVDIGDNHFVADISYRPPAVFKHLPVLVYNGMKIIHPLFQRIDMHSSLSFPYDNAPREVIFARWSKDITRFNLLDKHYPVGKSGDTVPLRECKASLDMRKYLFSGFAAYALLYDYYITAMTAYNRPPDSGVVAAKFTIGDNITFETLDQRLEIIHFDPETVATEMKQIKRYETYIHMIPERIEGLHGDTLVTVYSTQNRLLSANSITVNGSTIRIPNVQYLLKHFIAMHFMHGDKPKISNTYLARYVSLLRMISSYEEVVDIDTAAKSPLFPSVFTYGSENINLSRAVALNRLYHDLDDAPLFITPRNYYPARSQHNEVAHPYFDYASNSFFAESGLEKIESNGD